MGCGPVLDAAHDRHPSCRPQALLFAVQVFAGDQSNFANRCRAADGVANGCYVDTAYRFCADDTLARFDEGGELLACAEVVASGLCAAHAAAGAEAACCGCGGGTQCPGQLGSYIVSGTSAAPPLTAAGCAGAAAAIGEAVLGFSPPAEACEITVGTTMCGGVSYSTPDDEEVTIGCYVRGGKLWFRGAGITGDADDGTRKALCATGPPAPDVLSPCAPAVALDFVEGGKVTSAGGACPSPWALAREHGGWTAVLRVAHAAWSLRAATSR